MENSSDTTSNSKNIQIVAHSFFKDQSKADSFYSEWKGKIEQLNQCNYEEILIQTSLGKTMVRAINRKRSELKTLVIFPGFRTSTLFWDIDNGLAEIKKHCRIFLVETNGQPTLSHGDSPAIKSNDYGWWATEVFDQLKIEKATIAGASFGGLVCLKMALVAPQRVEKAILMNPGCLQSFSLKWKNLYYNMLPLISCNEKNVTRFLDNAVFYQNHHQPSPEGKKLVTDFELFVIREYKDKTQKPYAMSASDLQSITSDVYLMLGDKDILFPTTKSKAVAEKHLKHLKKTIVVPNVGHGIEISPVAMKHLLEIVRS